MKAVGIATVGAARVSVVVPADVDSLVASSVISFAAILDNGTFGGVYFPQAVATLDPSFSSYSSFIGISAEVLAHLGTPHPIIPVLAGSTLFVLCEDTLTAVLYFDLAAPPS